jgi:manganese transport protein
MKQQSGKSQDPRRKLPDRPPDSGGGKPASLEGVHGSVAVPEAPAGFWRQWRAFIGPAMLVSVGYMDPGNWGTDLAGGAQFPPRAPHKRSTHVTIC